MNATSLEPIAAARPHRRTARRLIQAFLAPLHQVARTSPFVRAGTYGSFSDHMSRYTLPYFVFTGPQVAGTETIRLGIFATVHGDEPEGALGLGQFFRELSANPHLAAGYEIRAYPLCNPTGYEDKTRASRNGKDLNREFWRASTEPEVILLEDELRRHSFHGLVSLHSDDTSDGLYGFFNGPDLSKDLLHPALWAAEKFLPRNHQAVIDGFPAQRGLIGGGYTGILSAPPEAQPAPFDMTFETPQGAPVHLQVAANNAALLSIIAEYRTLLAVAQNI